MLTEILGQLINITNSKVIGEPNKNDDVWLILKNKVKAITLKKVILHTT